MASYKSVLVVEDDQSIRETLCAMLEAEGYQPIAARNGLEALQKLRSGACSEPCLILLDMMMPQMNGWQFLEIRRHSDVIASIPVIIVSATTHGDIPSGASKILRKPVDLDTLLKEVETYCSQSASSVA